MFLTYLKRMAPYIIIAILFLIADRLFKSLAVNEFFGKTFALVGNLLVINYTRNYQLAFSLPFSNSWAIILIFIISAGILFYLLILLTRKSYAKAGILIFIILGAASNLYDRIVYGYVIDYLDLKYFTVFNVADIMIVGGIICMCICQIKKDEKTHLNVK